MNQIRFFIPNNFTGSISQYNNAASILRGIGLDALVGRHDDTRFGILVVTGVGEDFILVSSTTTTRTLLELVNESIPGFLDMILAEDELPISDETNLFNIPVPRFVWLLSAGYATFKTISAQQRLGQVGFGTLAAISWKNYLSE